MLAYTFVDATRWPKWVYDRRVQPDTEPPTLRHWLKTALVAVTGHLALGVISARFMIPVWARNVDKKGLRSLPDPLRAVATFVGLELAVEFLFYVGHRISHHRWFYKWMHKMHHENKSTFGMASFYTTPFDLVINNSLPAAVPIALSGAHPVILWFFMVWQGVRAVQAHCGYDVPFFNDAKFHDFHHEQFDGNYGINAGFALWDWLFGTAGPYFKHRASLKGGLRQKSADAKTANGIAGEAVHEE
ncbi:hypothetical protein DFJ74DRAFT_659962 [Hyaloraphidium curvatum]|nr:hypothetical protein DFJ74DRAFT_659962 [Hyaloraphidium curvatum]